MGRRIKLANPSRYEATPDPCVIRGCTTPPRSGALLCHFHARTLHRLAEEGTSR